MDPTERTPMTRGEARDLAAAGWAAYTLCALDRPCRPAAARSGQDWAKIVHVRGAACPMPPGSYMPAAARYPGRSIHAMDARAARLVRWLQPTPVTSDY